MSPQESRHAARSSAPAEPLKPKHTKIPPFNHALHITIGDTGWAHLHKLGIADDNEPPQVDALTIYDPSTIPARFAIWIHGNALTAPISHTAGPIAHEAVHTIDFLYQHIGENQRTDEITAYLIQWIVDQAFGHLVRAREDHANAPRTQSGPRR